MYFNCLVYLFVPLFTTMSDERPIPVEQPQISSAAPETGIDNASAVPENPSESPKEEQSTSTQGSRATHTAKTQSTAQQAATSTRSDAAPSDDDQKVDALLKVALHSGLAKATAEARKTKDPYIIDRFHDALVDELKRELIEKNKLKELS